MGAAPGSRVLMGKRRKTHVKDDPAIVLTVNPSERSFRVLRELDNRTFLLTRSKLLRDPAFADDDIIDGGSLSRTPGGDVPSPRGALRGDLSQVVSPIPRVCRRLRFLGLQ